MKEKIKIQINSLEALERLIGGDSEIEFQIRNNIVQDFVGRHLKSIASSELIKKTESAIINQLRDEFFVKKKGNYSWDEKWCFRDDLLEDFKKEITIKANHEIDKKINLIISDSASVKKLEGVIDTAVGRIVSSLTDENLNKRIDYLVEKRLKEKLGLN